MSTQEAWAKALERFEGGYGDPPDFNDPTDRAAFMALLTEEVAAGMEREFAQRFAEEAAKVRARLLAELEGDA